MILLNLVLWRLIKKWSKEYHNVIYAVYVWLLKASQVRAMLILNKNWHKTSVLNFTFSLLVSETAATLHSWKLSAED